LIHAGGRHVHKESHTIDGDGAQTDNLFTVTGAVRILSIRGIATTVTDATDFADVKFQTDDGGAQNDLCTTVDASGIVVGGMIYRNNVSTEALQFVNADVCNILDPDAAGAPPQVILDSAVAVVAKNGATTYVRLAFNGDANTDIVMDFDCEYEPLSDDGAMASV
jgi:hypothetical protein